MQLNDILLVCAAVLPAIVISIDIYKRDRAEKEPIGLLAVLFLLGVVICFPAAELEGWLIKLLGDYYQQFGRLQDGTLILSVPDFRSYMAVKAFCIVALVEEGLKFLVLVLVTKNNRNFNCLFDGLIFAVFVSLGFAAYENILYVLRYGWLTAFARAVLSVPGHTFNSILMGCGYTMWNICRKARLKENSLLQQGLISKPKRRFISAPYLVLSLVVPVLAHGFYDYCCFLETKTARLILAGFVLFLYGACFFLVSHLSEKDDADTTYSDTLVRKKYPHLFSKNL